MSDLPARAGKVLDALLGREGARLDAAELRRFYAEDYLARNPALDVADVPHKARLLVDVCKRAGITSATSVLEVGAGSGELLVHMKKALGAKRAVGADYSAEIAAVARARSGLEIVATDGETLPFADGELDLAYFADVLEHVLHPVPWLREVGRVARRVAFLVPLESGLVANAIYAARRSRGKRTNYEQYGHIWRFFRADVARIAKAAGLAVEASFVAPVPTSVEGLNANGRALERLRGGVAGISPRASELLFGGATFLGVATPRAVRR